MASTNTIGLILIGLSAVLLAWHWQPQASKDSCGTNYRQTFFRRQLQRRTVASSLVGLIGVAFLSFEQVPQTPIAVTTYVCVLTFATCWVLWLGLMDVVATRQLQHREELDQIAAELKRANPKAKSTSSSD